MLAFACLPHGSDPAIQLDADASLIIWQAILNTAKASGYQPLNGTLEETTVVEAGGVLRSNYTPTGGTTDLNLEVIDTLEQGGVNVVTEPTQAALRDAPVVIYAADTSHGGATRLDGAYGEQLRFGMHHHRRGPRIELREAVAIGGNAQVRWFAPHDDDVLGYQVLASTAGGPWELAAETAANEDSVSFVLSGGVRVRVVPVMPDLSGPIGSDVYSLADGGEALVIDGFDRVIDGSFGGLSHDFAAVVGEAAGAAGTVSNEALTEGGFGLSAPAAIWLLGDESTADRPFTPAERNVLEGYVLSGGSVIVSGSEVAYAVDVTTAGTDLLADIFGASFAADDSGSYSVSGVGSLASVGSFTYAGPTAPYEEDYPDVLGAQGAGEPLLAYANGDLAAVGVANKSALVGFPLELVDGETERTAVLSALLQFVR